MNAHFNIKNAHKRAVAPTLGITDLVRQDIPILIRQARYLDASSGIRKSRRNQLEEEL